MKCPTRTRLYVTCLALVPLIGGRQIRGQEPIAGISASISRPVFPVLIGNRLNPLMRLVIDVGKADLSDLFPRDDVRLTSISFTLAGTDDLRDLQSLTLYSTGSDEDLMQQRWPGDSRVREPERTLIGGPVRAATTVTFHPDRPLLGGRNIFWLSCRLSGWAGRTDRIAVACNEIVTSAGRLAVLDGSSGVRGRVGLALRRHGDDGVDTYGIPALTTTAKGTLLCVYDMRWRYPGHDLQDEITTGLSRSTDGGIAWEPVRIIMDMGEYGGLPRNQNGCSDPGIVVDRRTGDIYAFSVWMNGKPGKHQWMGNGAVPGKKISQAPRVAGVPPWTGDGAAPGYEIGQAPQIVMVHSRDDGRTWTRPENLTRKLKPEAWWLIAPSPQSGIQLDDGTLVMPMEGRDESGYPFSTIMTSRDHGANWTVGTPAFHGGNECQAVQLGDGSIMLNMRDQAGGNFHRVVYVTRDLGRTWQPHPTDRKALIEPICNASLIRVDYEEAGQIKHVLLFANPHSATQRVRINQTIQVSFDDGMTWPEDHHLLLDQGRAWAYPSMTRIDDRNIGIVYSSSQADLAFQIIPLDQLLHPHRP